MCRAMILAGLGAAILWSGGVMAEDRVLWDGWTNITPCQKVEWRKGFANIPSPTYKQGPQELHCT